MTMTGTQIAAGFITVFFLLWLVYLAYGRKAKWAFLGWFPFTLVCALVVFYWLIQAASMGGSGLANGFFGQGVIMFAPVAALSLGLFIVSFIYRPTPISCSPVTGLVTAGLCILAGYLVLLPSQMEYRKNRYQVRVRFIDEKGNPLENVALGGWQKTDLRSDADGMVLLGASKKESLNWSYSSYFLRPYRKNGTFNITYVDGATPHIHVHYIIDEGRGVLNERRIREDQNIETDYPFKPGPIDISIAMDVVK